MVVLVRMLSHSHDVAVVTQSIKIGRGDFSSKRRNEDPVLFTGINIVGPQHLRTKREEIVRLL